MRFVVSAESKNLQTFFSKTTLIPDSPLLPGRVWSMRMRCLIPRFIVGQDLGIYRGVAKPNRGPLVLSWPLTRILLVSFSTDSFLFFWGCQPPIDNPRLTTPHTYTHNPRLSTPGRKGRSRLNKIPKKISQRPAWYKGPQYGLATSRYILRSCPTA